MIPMTPEDRVSAADELLHSLRRTVMRLRRQAELLCESLQSRSETELGDIGNKIAAVEGLIRTCQKVEISVVEQERRTAAMAKEGIALDLDAARAELGKRLARLHDEIQLDDVSERNE